MSDCVIQRGENWAGWRVTYTKTPKRRTRMPISKASSRMFFLRSGGDAFMVGERGGDKSVKWDEQRRPRSAAKGCTLYNPQEQSGRFASTRGAASITHAARLHRDTVTWSSLPRFFSSSPGSAARRLFQSPRAVFLLQLCWWQLLLYRVKVSFLHSINYLQWEWIVGVEDIKHRTH